jgi:chromosome segregation ATPase
MAKSKKSTQQLQSKSCCCCCAAIKLFQIAGGTAEPLHEQPIRHFRVVANPQNPKQFTLLFRYPKNQSSQPSMLTLLCDDQRLQLQASNRLARESLLLAIGIANFKGKPSDLDISTILYAAENVGLDALDEDYEMDVSSASSASSSSSIGQKRQQLTSPLQIHRPPLLTMDEPTFHSRFIIVHTKATASSESPHQRSTSLDSSSRLFASASSTVDCMNIDTSSAELEREVVFLREKLARKDKIISELQRQVTSSDEALRNAEQKLSSTKGDLEKSIATNKNLQQSIVVAEKHIASSERKMEDNQRDWELKIRTLESELEVLNNRILALEKANRTLANEKDILTAAVEAREGKLARMAELQSSLEEMTTQVSQQHEMQKLVDQLNERWKDAQSNADRIALAKIESEKELEGISSELKMVKEQLGKEVSKTVSHQSELEKEQMKIQKLKAERNSYKQKGDSLAKEMACICRNGRTVREVEKILADDATRRQEVELLREQKRKAVEELEHYRKAYEQSLHVQLVAGLDHETAKLLERNAELERLLSELTEYVTAKEMQLETMKEVNDALQNEIRDLAKANMRKNEI